jgi:hypothetical protein
MTEPASNMPNWAKNIDDRGKLWWNKEKPVRNRRGEYIASLIFNLIWLFIVNKIPDWNLEFINDHYPAVLWALNMNIFIQIGGNIVMLIFDVRIVRYLSRAVLEAANFLVMIILYYIFPFDFSGVPGWSFLDWLIPWLLIIGMVVSAFKVLGNIWKLIFWR